MQIIEVYYLHVLVISQWNNRGDNTVYIVPRRSASHTKSSAENDRRRKTVCVRAEEKAPNVATYRESLV